MTERKTIMSGAVLKLIAMGCMLIDHLACGFLEVGRAPLEMWLRERGAERLIAMIFPLDLIGRIIGRTAFPVFCFFLVEGFFHTRSRIKYLRNMAIFALISEVPFDLLFFPESGNRHSNVYFTLLLGLAAVWGMQWCRERSGVQKWLRIAGMAAAGGLTCAAAWLWDTDYGAGGVIAIILLYLFHASSKAPLLAWIWLTLYNASEIFAFLSVILIRCYNGKRGRQMKILFYLFYPVHILLIYLIRRIWLGM